MIRTDILLLSGMLALAVGCGDDSTAAVPDMKTLPVPDVAVAVSDRTATVRWSISEPVEAVRFTFELYAGDAAAPLQSATTRLQSQRFEMEPGVSYRFRVLAAAPLGSAGWQDSAFSDFATFSTEGPADPDVDLGLPLANENDGVLRAFPGAEGGGMYTSGGRGGRIYRVTNLNDSGAGSFRAAVEASGKRIVVFDVAGTIHLTSDLRIRNDNLTVAGQTAPGGGVCIAGGTVVVDADNVIIRYMRFRLGDLNTGGNLSDGSDTIWGRYHKDIILDHCSMSWSIDECASFYANQNFTMQWCLLTESLRKSAHGKGDHAIGRHWGGKSLVPPQPAGQPTTAVTRASTIRAVYGSYLSTHSRQCRLPQQRDLQLGQQYDLRRRGRLVQRREQLLQARPGVEGEEVFRRRLLAQLLVERRFCLSPALYVG